MTRRRPRATSRDARDVRRRASVPRAPLKRLQSPLALRTEPSSRRIPRALMQPSSRRRQRHSFVVQRETPAPHDPDPPQTLNTYTTILTKRKERDRQLPLFRANFDDADGSSNDSCEDQAPVGQETAEPSTPASEPSTRVPEPPSPTAAARRRRRARAGAKASLQRGLARWPPSAGFVALRPHWIRVGAGREVRQRSALAGAGQECCESCSE